jgi:sulfinoalanine decarboxylase
MQDKELLEKIAKTLQYSNTKSNNRLIKYQSITELTEILDLNKQSTQDWAQLFVWVQQYLNYSPNTGHTGFANRMWSGANAPSILGLNSQCRYLKYSPLYLANNVHPHSQKQTKVFD